MNSPHLRLLSKGIEFLMAAMLLVMVIMTFANVVLRYVFNSGITESEELSRYLFVWLTFIGAVVVLYEGGHQAVMFLPERLPAPLRIVCDWIATLLTAFAAILLGVGSGQQALLNFDNYAPVTGIPVGVLYLAGFVSSVGIVGLLGLHLVSLSWAHRGRRDADHEADR